MERKPNVTFTPTGALVYMTNCMPVIVPREQDSEEEYRKRVEIAIKDYTQPVRGNHGTTVD